MDSIEQSMCSSISIYHQRTKTIFCLGFCFYLNVDFSYVVHIHCTAWSGSSCQILMKYINIIPLNEYYHQLRFIDNLLVSTGKYTNLTTISKYPRSISNSCKSYGHKKSLSALSYQFFNNGKGEVSMEA